MAELLASTALLVAGCMLALWLVSLAMRDASIVDIFWGARFPWVSLATVFGLQGVLLWTVSLPDCFGDFCVKWGTYAVALGTVHGAWTIVGPTLMSFSLLRVSGVPMLERTIGKRRPDDAEYARTTSACFPRPPRRIP